MPPKKILSIEKINLINLVYAYCLEKRLSIRLYLPYIFERYFNEKISYTTLSKYIGKDLINIDHFYDIIVKSLNYLIFNYKLINFSKCKILFY